MEKKTKELKKELKEVKQDLKEIRKLTRKEKLLLNAKKSAVRFKGEFNKSVKTAVVGAFGFLVALSWRDLITEYVEKVSSLSPVKGKLISAILVTLICAVGIFVATELFSEKAK